MAETSACWTYCEGNDWLMLNGDVESLRDKSQVDAISASQHQYQMDQKDHHSAPASNNEHPTVNTQQWIFKLFVWHDGLKTPIELVDETKKPLGLSADKTCSLEELKWMIHEMVIIHPLLSSVFPHVTRQNVRDSIQVCKRSDTMEWVPLGKTVQTAPLENEEKEKNANLTRLQLIHVVEDDHDDEQERDQLLVESKFEGACGDFRRGKFYSDLAWRLELQLGQLVDALDTENRWYESRVVAMNSKSVKVHYRGWSSKWDEWLSRTSSRLAPLHTKVRNWRAFHVNDELLVGSEVPGKQYPEWRNARVTACDTMNGLLQIEVDVDGKKRWLDAQDELLCPKGAHKAVNASPRPNSLALFAPSSLLTDYFEQRENILPLRPHDNVLVGAESVSEILDAMQLPSSDVDGEEWCVVDDTDEGEHVDTDLVATTKKIIINPNTTPSTGSDPADICLRGTASPAVMTTDDPTKKAIDEENAWRDQLQMNQLIDACDTSNVWYESRVVAVSATLVKVHYRGWTFKWDEWINRMSTRIAPLHTKVQNWRDFKVGNAVMVGRQVVGKTCPDWRNAVVTACKKVDQLRIEVNVDGTKQWMGAQDEMLCPPGTHKASSCHGD